MGLAFRYSAKMDDGKILLLYSKIWVGLLLLPTAFRNSKVAAKNIEHVQRRKLATENPGFISIDCGVDDDYFDGVTGIFYKSDKDFISTGTNKVVASEYTSTHPYFGRQLNSLRMFPEGKRNCYTLKPNQGKNHNYNIRIFFYYGNYDFKNQSQGFDLYLGVNYWASVVVKDRPWEYYSIIQYSLTDTIHVCLINTGFGVPFISGLDLRYLNDSSYRIETGISLGPVVQANLGGDPTQRIIRVFRMGFIDGVVVMENVFAEYRMLYPSQVEGLEVKESLYFKLAKAFGFLAHLTDTIKKPWFLDPRRACHQLLKNPLNRLIVFQFMLRYKDDVYDRIWWQFNLSKSVPISTTTSIDVQGSEDPYRLPAEVLITAVRPGNGTNSLSYSYTYPYKVNFTPEFLFYFHFAEIEQIAQGQVREFTITLNGIKDGPFTLEYLKPLTIHPNKSVQGDHVNFSIDATSRSDLPPILNAFEIFAVWSLPVSPTNQADVDAIMAIKKTYGIDRADWQGDPCLPITTWTGLNCNSDNPPRIISL
ncbi:unnamed protein product [Dovyalis caffra]|uniref:Malectin-like domain-containing protein n=1 Tax=Dovyalis caffra TaxID=77055 RepID=A0AAV1QLX0_9ROSI|nr:unnamed protein product [Dovyalis caffra]